MRQEAGLELKVYLPVQQNTCTKNDTRKKDIYGVTKGRHRHLSSLFMIMIKTKLAKETYQRYRYQNVL